MRSEQSEIVASTVVSIVVSSESEKSERVKSEC